MENGVFLSHAEPVLAVKDVSETVLYWHHVLGFQGKWTWGEPPGHGGVSWHGAFIQFSRDPQLALRSKGNSIFIRVRQLEALYDFHQQQQAEIVEPLENKPWGMAGYTVREINGYYISFAGALISNRDKSLSSVPQSVRIIRRIPSAKEYLNLVSAVGWGNSTIELTAEKILSAPVFAVVAEDSISNEVIGCGLLLGDNAGFFYVKDVMIHPHWQSKRIGSAMMKELTQWLDSKVPSGTFTVLMTRENLAPFYQQFGFSPAFGMVRQIQRDEN